MMWRSAHHSTRHGPSWEPGRRCGHRYPILVTPTDSGYYARCLGCGAIGPEHPSSRAAQQALETAWYPGSGLLL
jgi:hypothetical protein